MTEHQPATDAILQTFDFLHTRHAGRGPAWLLPLRKAALTRFAELGFPTLQQEDWRFTNLAPIIQLPFKPKSGSGGTRLTQTELAGFAFHQLPGSRLVFVDGCFAPELSSVAALPPGVRVTSLQSALDDDPAFVEQHLARYASHDDNAFAALNTAFFQDGLFIHVPAGTAFEAPVHAVFVTTSADTGTTAQCRNLVLVERGGSLTLIESYVSTVAGVYFTNAVTELVAGDNAVIEHCKFQDESPRAFHLATLHAQLGRNARVQSHSMALGAKISRNTIRTRLAGEGIECVLNGLYLTKETQLADHHMIVEHLAPHCASHEYFNGILDDRSRGVFHGRIYVHPAAQKTDAKQTNKNMLLSDEATVDTKPQLEIYADDVKCTHGATVGQLNDESIFYLRARGIGEETARRMLIHAFAGEIVERIQCEPVREELDRIVWDRLEMNPQIAAK